MLVYPKLKSSNSVFDFNCMIFNNRGYRLKVIDIPLDFVFANLRALKTGAFLRFLSVMVL